jgi:Zn-dependent protease
MRILDLLVLVPVLLLSIVVHEVAHAWQARREGDHTAERQGRITLNPLPHLDPVGSFVVPLLLWAASAGFIFGWAKPVPVVPSNYRDPVWGDVRVSLAGIVSNLGLAAGFALLGAGFVALGGSLRGSTLVAEIVGQAVIYGLFINLILAFFNLIPVPPLDGSHVVYHLLPRGIRDRYRELGRFGILILMGVLFLVPGAFNVLLAPVNALMGVADSFMRMWA